jgi:hypothetical protein
MAIQNDGRIDMDDLVNEFSHPSNPAPLDQFYRNGSYVPGSIPGTPTSGRPGFCTKIPGSDESGTITNSPGPTHPCDHLSGFWACSTPSYSYGLFWVNPHNECYQTGGYIPCIEGSPSGSWNTGGCTMHANNWTPPTSPQPGTPIPINEGVPTSGKISLDNFYGAEKR